MLKLIVLSIVLLAVSIEACPQGWQTFQNSCYFSSATLGDDSYASKAKRSRHWYSAQRECKKLGATLAEINSQAELQFVRKLAMRGRRTSWIGGTDSANEGEWKWISGAPITVSDFKPLTDPQMMKYDRPERQDCLAIAGYLDFHWRGIFCIQGYEYICEKANN
ncbi:CD209 antigen-like protein E [Mytilus trossulus]|uniref:CD209 antigen-like protein E n=1 Tax=Mytilus trossulus TaxID=6551 RepID=UPI0030069887